MKYFPPGVDKFNAYSIHGSGDQRIFRSLFPVPGEFPDFHRTQDFGSFNKRGLSCQSQEGFSDVWQKALENPLG